MRLNRFSILIAASFSAVALVASACGGNPDPTATPRPATPTPQVSATATPGTTATPEATATPVPTPGTAVSTVEHPTLGTVLSDTDGNILYLFTNDRRDVSNCSGGCANAWPPLTTEGDPVAEGDAVAADRLGTIERADGSLQVTYNGWPLYYYAADTEPETAGGQALNSVWFVVSPYGGPVQTDAIVSTRNHSELETYLTDQTGRTLYLFTNDETGVSNCAGPCALAWPPVLTVNAPMATQDAVQSRLGTIERADGSLQVTYEGMPLYYFAADSGPDAITGQGRNDVWWVVSPSGTAITTIPTPPTTPTPEVTETPSAPATVNSSISGSEFEDLTVTVGTTVTWTNNDATAHNVVSTGNFQSPTLNQGATFSHTFNAAGTYNYVCNFHDWMTATVTVV